MAGYNMLKTAEDLKQYLQNLLTEYQFGCFGENNSEVCDLLGDYYEEITRDYNSARKIYRSNCVDNNFGKSCTKYGTYLYHGRGMKDSCPSDAYIYFTKGCELNDSEGCFRQGLLLASNEFPTDVVPHDPKKAVVSLKKSCMANYCNACDIAGNLCATGLIVKQSDDTNVVELEKDFKTAAECWKKGCELNNVLCCTKISDLYEKGIGVKKNKEFAEKYRQRALRLEAQSYPKGVKLQTYERPDM